MADPRSPGSVEKRVVRGGAWYYYAYYCRAALRWPGPPTDRVNNLGLRVAVGAP